MPSERELDYQPTFFRREWAFVLAACDRLIPSDDIGPGAVELGVPEFIDRHMQTPYAAGGIHYLDGPFLAAAPEFGYQGGLSPRDILRTGIAAADAHCMVIHDGRAFAELDAGDQDAVLGSFERGEVEFDAMNARYFFLELLGEVRMGYFADPVHGGNRDMGAWRMIGYPGMAVDFREWIGAEAAYSAPPTSAFGSGSQRDGD